MTSRSEGRSATKILGGFSKAYTAAVYYGPVAAVSLIFLALALAFFGHLFLMNEYRQWSDGATAFNPLVIFAPSTLLNSSVPSVAFSRSFTFEIVAGISGTCGYNAVCHNAIHIGILTVSGFLLGLLLLRLFWGKPVVAIAGAVIFFFSAQPVLDALSWQATLLDKLALFFTACATYAVARLDLRRTDLLYVVAGNVGLLLLIFAAYNSKEASFGLMPSLWVLLAIRFWTSASPPQTFGGVVRRTTLLLGAPLIYAIFHVAVVLTDRVFLQAAETARVTGGHAEFNFYHYFLYFFNVQGPALALGAFPFAPENVLVSFAAYTGLLTAVIAFIVVKVGNKTVSLLWFWALGSFIMAFLLPLRTTGIPAFYLLVPLFYLSIVVCATSVVFLDAARGVIAKMSVQIVVAVLIVLHVLGLGATIGQYDHIIKMSDNFSSALAAARKIVSKQGAPTDILFLWPKSESLTYMFLGSSGSRSLAPYLLPAGSSRAELSSTDDSIQDAPYAGSPDELKSPTDVTIILGENLKLERIELPHR